MATDVQERDRLTINDVRDQATLTVAEAAALLGQSLSSTYRAVHDRSLPSVRVGGRIHIPVPRLLALLEGRTAETSPTSPTTSTSTED